MEASAKNAPNEIVQTELNQDVLDKAIIKFIVKDLQPLPRVESPAFRNRLLGMFHKHKIQFTVQII